MALHSFKTVQQIPVSIERAWDFFSSPANLQAITPPSMKFTILSPGPERKMYPGQIIEYRVRPVWNIPVYWVTEITHVDEYKFFVDEQRTGPYKIWHHQHHFETIPGGIKMTDIVHYKNPLWFLGDIANDLFVKHQLKTIFDYRQQKIEELFGQWA
jgi:ligand-binding SRPBCC domain-containing protein